MPSDDDFQPGADEADFDESSATASRSTRRNKQAFADDYEWDVEPAPPRKEPRQRSSASHSKIASRSSGIPPPKVKVKFNQAADNTSINLASMAKKYDRELDSDPDEPLIIEEQFILRLPEGEMAKQMAELISKKEIGSAKTKAAGVEPWLRFRDTRRAVFGFGKPDDPKQSKMYSARLVDLPTIIESHKTLDHGKHLYKVADINQMLVVEDELKPGQDPAFFDDREGFNIEDYSWPHGLTPPLHHVRKRRFRRRTSKRTIEAVERAVEALLLKDGKSKKVEYELVDPSTVIDEEPATPVPATPVVEEMPEPDTPLPLDSGPAELADLTEDEEDEPMPSPSTLPQTNGQRANGFASGTQSPVAQDSADEDEDGIDDDLAAELAKGMQAMDEDSGSDEGPPKPADDDSDDLFGSGAESLDEAAADAEEGGSEDEGRRIGLENRLRTKMLNEEIRALEKSVKDRTADIARSSNPIIKARFEIQLKNVSAALDQKRAQLAALLAGPEEQEEEEGEAVSQPATAAATPAP